MADKIKLVIAAFLVIAGIAGYYYLDGSPAIIRVLSVLGGLVLAAVVGWTSAPGKQFLAFAKDSVEETKKVVWPTRKETFQTTGIVFLFVLVMAIFLWIVDASLLWAVEMLMGRGGA